jgi:hypothetical protein
MKKISAVTLLLFSIIASAQNEVAEDSTAKPAITAIGIADGLKTETKIGKEGGRLASSDGKIELIVPQGAVSKKISFRILPITNMIPNGNGKAYRLEPSGIQFQKPVQLIFHYTEEESADSMQLLMGIAMQDNTGQWYGLRKFTLDTIAKTISGNINHFSDWSKFESIKLYPPHFRLKVKKVHDLSIDLISSEEEDLPPLYSDELFPLLKSKLPWAVTYKANEITNGNTAVGTIAVHEKRSITYKAPDLVPAKNPVALTAKLTGISYKYKGIIFRDLTLVSNILIYDDAYEVKMISVVNGMAGSVLGACRYKDMGSFVVSLNGKDSKVIEKVNNNTAAELDYKGQCRVVTIKPGSGNIHIAGRQVIKITPPSSPNGSPTIEITFSRYPTIFPLLEFTCPDGNRGTFTSTNAKANGLAAGMLAAAPQQIKFEAKDGEQIQVIGEEGSGIYFKYIITRLKQD